MIKIRKVERTLRGERRDRSETKNKIDGDDNVEGADVPAEIEIAERAITDYCIIHYQPHRNISRVRGGIRIVGIDLQIGAIAAEFEAVSLKIKNQ